VWEVIVFIISSVFWIAVWVNVSAVRKSLASIERNSARMADRLAPLEPGVIAPARVESELGLGRVIEYAVFGCIIAVVVYFALFPGK
jgi:hypothetical protein